MKKIATQAAYTISVLLVLALFSSGQTIGTPPFGSFGGGPFDVINLSNLNVHFTVPLVHKAGRGLPFAYDLVYDSSVWTPGAVSGVATWQPWNNYWGWQNLLGASFSNLTYSTTFTSGTCGPTNLNTWQAWTFSNFVYTNYTGTHNMGFGASFIQTNGTLSCPTPGPSPSTPQTVPAQDGSGLKLYASPPTAGAISASVYDTQGVTYSAGAPYNATDANGNQITSSGGVYTDTLGTTAMTVSSAPPPTNTTFNYTAPSGGALAAKYTVSYVSYTVKTNFGCSGIAEYNTAGIYLVDRITLQDGTFYQFAYEPTAGGTSGQVTGRLASVTLPTGGSIAYQYAMNGTHNGINCADGSAPIPSGTTPSLTRTLSPGGAWKYSRNQISGLHWQTTVTDPTAVANQTLIDFQSIYETQRQVYAGTATGTALKTTITCYNGLSVSLPSLCPAAGVAPPISRQTVFSYLPGTATTMEAETDTQYYGTIAGFASEVDTYDYGSSGTAGGILNSVITSFSPVGNQVLPSSVIVKDSSTGTTRASTTYAYDQTTATPTTSTPNHTSVTVARGNLTSIGTQTASGATLYKRLTYYDTGMPNTVSDLGTTMSGGSNLITYHYNNTGTPSPSCGNSFATSISEPISPLARSFTWNCDGAVMISATDENSQATPVDYTADTSFWRPDFVKDPLLNKTTFNFTGQTVTESNLSFNGGNSVTDVRTTLDGFGRVILNQRAQTPSLVKYDSTQTDYNLSGQVSRATMPFQATAGTSSGTAPGTTTVYDALGRPQTVTDGGGGTVSYTYNNNDVLQVTGPTQTFTKQFEYDGLGRLTSVCEVTAGTTAAPGGTCGQTNTQTGYWTKYTYDALGSLLTVTQNAQAMTGQQTRTYTYDMMSRLTLEKNPETGTTSGIQYTYDVACTTSSASAGDLTLRVDNAGNHTCYGYDALHRLTDEGFTHTATSTCRHFRYDSQTPPTGVTVSNTLARATEAFTDNCTSGKITDEWFGFDADGRLTDFYESTPHSGGYYHTSASYWANGGLNALSGLTSTSTAIFPTIYYGASTGTGLDGEGRITTVNAASGSIPLTGVNYVVSGTTEPIGALTSVTYGSTDGDSFTYDPSTGRPKIYTFTVNGATDKGSLTWNTNGTLSKLVIADSLPGATDTQTCNYFYDDLGRLAGKNTNGYSVDCGASKWQQLFTLDAFGNIAKSGTSSFAATYSTTNQFTVSGVTITYDANGNLLTDNLSNTYTWDANWGNPARVNSTNLIYDALGQMVEQQTGSTSTQMLYSQLGKTALMNGQTLTVAFINLPGGGTAIYNSTGLAYYRHTDWLDSSRLTSTSSRTVSSDLAYAPYGEQYLATGTADPSYTGQNSDTTSSLYDFTFRENSPSQGRWVSPDPSGTAAVDPANPQTWNRYAYVMNNPLTSIDPLGLADLNNINELSSGVYLICNHNPGDREGMSGGDGSYSQIYQYQGGPIQWPNQQLVSCVIVIPGFNSPNQGSSGSADNGTKKQQKKCLSEYNNSAEGKITKFFSLYDAATNWSHVWKEWTLWPGIKVAAATVLKSIGEGVGTTEFLSVTGGASTVVTGPTAAGITAAEGGLAPVTPFVIGASTVLDVAVHVQCALDPSLPANGIPIAPKVVGH